MEQSVPLKKGNKMTNLKEAVNNLNSTESAVSDRIAESENWFNQMGCAVIHFDLVEVLRIANVFKDDVLGMNQGAVMNINPLNVYNYFRFYYDGMLFGANDCDSNNKDGCCLPPCCAHAQSDGTRCKDYNHEMYTTVS